MSYVTCEVITAIRDALTKGRTGSAYLYALINKIPYEIAAGLGVASLPPTANDNERI